LIEKELRYFFHIGYNGFNYHGWQKLPQANSVQVIIETQLSRILKTPVAIVGCGRTDSQVHASQFFFHVDLERHWDFDLLFRLNKNLPDDIAVFDIFQMEGLPHARLDAVGRTYNYFIHNYKDPYLSNISSLYPEKGLNLDNMKRAVSLLTKYDDYRAFCRMVSSHRTTLCQITQANLFIDQRGDNIRFEISANRFLYGMIRILMHQLLEIGYGKVSVDQFEDDLISKKSAKVKKAAHPQGLFLSSVRYPYLQTPSRSELFNTLAHPDRWKPI
jgi:tRNA pseudouridine38-40 synthase